jgi:hypothetical protein
VDITGEVVCDCVVLLHAVLCREEAVTDRIIRSVLSQHYAVRSGALACTIRKQARQKKDKSINNTIKWKKDKRYTQYKEIKHYNHTSTIPHHIPDVP